MCMCRFGDGWLESVERRADGMEVREILACPLSYKQCSLAGAGRKVNLTQGHQLEERERLESAIVFKVALTGHWTLAPDWCSITENFFDRSFLQIKVTQKKVLCHFDLYSFLITYVESRDQVDKDLVKD